jgi:hypothetical protein
MKSLRKNPSCPSTTIPRAPRLYRPRWETVKSEVGADWNAVFAATVRIGPRPYCLVFWRSCHRKATDDGPGLWGMPRQYS